MPSMTLPFKTVIELSGGVIEQHEGLTTITGADVGLNYYPIWDEEDRVPLNGMIVDRYMNREIAHETIDEFRRAMRSRMNEIMPYYIDLHRTTQLEFDPLVSVDIETTGSVIGSDERTTQDDSQTESESTGSNTSKNNSKSRTVSSDFPQTMLNESGDYASAASDANSQSDGEGETTDESTVTAFQSGQSRADQQQESSNRTKGYQGSPSAMIEAYRATLLNIKVMIVDDLSDLFSILWNTGDAYSEYGDPKHFTDRMLNT